jgi:hypothetical protein
MPRGGKVKTVLRQRIWELLQTGETQASIAPKLNKATSTIVDRTLCPAQNQDTAS